MAIMIARQGERWEQLCFRFYNRTTQSITTAVMEANIELAHALTTSHFSGGEAITMPDIDESQTEIVEVPPWRK